MVIWRDLERYFSNKHFAKTIIMDEHKDTHYEQKKTYEN